ncbi:hypothetical protein [Dyadobacter sp. CY326]|uniref:hypothetical protein n=1 Tax=Dyadobacter sp. CY326 TaxID=2907300 RepID=UPI001F1AF73A|nr:hypothetical protein [Dyadobacter sp. CY326]MCE7068631.1 hypothetical protein [Dyadobacter sp. CY326]
MALSWKSNLSGTECRIFRDKLIVGLLKTSIWKEDGYGELNGHLLRFKGEGWFNTTTKILDIEGKKELGKIRYNYWKGSATINYEDQEYEWKFQSWTRKKWVVQNAEDAATFQLSSFWKNEGSVDNDYIPAGIILSALYVSNYWRKIAASS